MMEPETENLSAFRPFNPLIWAAFLEFIIRLDFAFETTKQKPQREDYKETYPSPCERRKSTVSCEQTTNWDMKLSSESFL